MLRHVVMKAYHHPWVEKDKWEEAKCNLHPEHSNSPIDLSILQQMSLHANKTSCIIEQRQKETRCRWKRVYLPDHHAHLRLRRRRLEHTLHRTLPPDTTTALCQWFGFRTCQYQQIRNRWTLKCFPFLPTCAKWKSQANDVLFVLKRMEWNSAGTGIAFRGIVTRLTHLGVQGGLHWSRQLTLIRFVSILRKGMQVWCHSNDFQQIISWGRFRVQFLAFALCCCFFSKSSDEQKTENCNGHFLAGTLFLNFASKQIASRCNCILSICYFLRFNNNHKHAVSYPKIHFLRSKWLVIST